MAVEAPVEPLPFPADFDDYWQAVRDEAARAALQPQREPWELAGRALVAGVQVWHVSFAAPDGVLVGGLWQLPANPQPGRGLPALVHFAGYGGEVLLHQDLVSAGFAVFDFSHRGMKLGSQNFDRHRPRPLLIRDVEDRDRYVYRSIYLECLLALRWVRSQPEVDPERVGVLGTSQGGGLAIGVAALDGAVRAVAADLPWLTHFAYQLARGTAGPYSELVGFVREHPELEERVRRTLAYFDALSFARRLRCPTLISLGQEDEVCPPESVRALFAAVPTVKVLLEVPGLGHARSQLWRGLALDWMRRWV